MLLLMLSFAVVVGAAVAAIVAIVWIDLMLLLVAYQTLDLAFSQKLIT